MIDDVTREPDLESGFVDEIPYDEIVREIFADGSIAADFPDGIFAERDGRGRAGSKTPSN